MSYISQGSGVGDAGELTAAEESFVQNAAGLSYVQGDILYRGSSDLVRLGIGSANQILRINTGATAPEWASISDVASLSFAPIAAQYVVLTANSDLTNERLLTGTTNQITITDNGAGSTVILGTPQGIATTSNVTFNNITADGTLNITGTVTGPSGTWDSGGMDIATGDSYAINGTDVLVAATLGSGVTASSLTSLGTLSSDLLIGNNTGIVVGHTAQIAFGEITSEAQVVGTTETDASLAIGLWSETNALAPILKLMKSGHASIGASNNTTVADNEELGKIQSYGADGSDLATLVSEIGFFVDDSSVGAGQIGGEIILSTATSGGTLTTALTISNTQTLTFGNLMVINPSGTGTQNVISMTPSGALAADATWQGYHLDGAALDPSGTGVEITGLDIHLDGVSETNNPEIHAVELSVPFGQDAIHIEEGIIHLDSLAPSTVASEFSSMQILIDSTALDTTSDFHGIDVSTIGFASGDVVAMLVRSNVAPIHHDITSFSTPDQTTPDAFAGLRTGGGASFNDGIDTVEFFVVNSDEILIGAAAQFAQIEVIMSSEAIRDTRPTFHYNTAADTWTEFFPLDGTEGFQESGFITWELGAISALWTSNGDPGAGDTATGFWIRIIRTRVADPGTPTATTMRTGTVAELSWDRAGVITGLTLEATGDTSSDDNAAMGYTSTEGLILTGQGSTNDITIKNDADATVISILTGTTNVTFANSLFLTEQAEADTDVDDQGQLWVDTATPNIFMFTDDAGTDFTIAHNATTTLSSLVSIGTITTGVWQGTTVAVNQGGTGVTTSTGTTNVVLSSSPTLVTPTLGVFSATTASTIGTLTLADGSITDSTAAISFGNENLSTTGTLQVSGNVTLGLITSSLVELDVISNGVSTVRISSDEDNNSADTDVALHFIIDGGTQAAFMTFDQGLDQLILGRATTTGIAMESDGGVFFPNLGTATTGTNLLLASGDELRPDSSSRRFKKNIKALAIDTSRIFDLVPKSFQFKEDSSDDFGYIAEEVALVMPELVFNRPDYKIVKEKVENGAGTSHKEPIPGTEKPFSVNYNRLVIPIIEEMKILKQRIKILEG